MKTLKIEPRVHKLLKRLTLELEQTTMSDTIYCIMYYYCQEHDITLGEKDGK